MEPKALYARDVEIAARYGVTRQTIWRWVAEGRFPPPVKLSPKCTRFRISDAEKWEQQQEGRK